MCILGSVHLWHVMLQNHEYPSDHEGGAHSPLLPLFSYSPPPPPPPPPPGNLVKRVRCWSLYSYRMTEPSQKHDICKTSNAVSWPGVCPCTSLDYRCLCVHVKAPHSVLWSPSHRFLGVNATDINHSAGRYNPGQPPPLNAGLEV